MMTDLGIMVGASYNVHAGNNYEVSINYLYIHPNHYPQLLKV